MKKIKKTFVKEEHGQKFLFFNCRKDKNGVEKFKENGFWKMPID